MKGRTAIAVVAAIAAVALVFVAWRHAAAEPGAPEQSRTPTAPEVQAPPAAPVQSTVAQSPIPSQRVPVDGSLGTGAEPGVSQGWRGVVLDPDHQPLAGVHVYLFESSTNEPLAAPLVVQHRLPLATLATVRTGTDGTFAIGLPIVEAKAYELFVVADGFAAARQGGLRLLANEWFDLGVVTLDAGVTVRGRVTVAGAGTPIPTASVSIETATGFVDATLRAMPGTANLTTTTDGNGAYELRNVPRHGQVRLLAQAPGFARILRGGLDMSGDASLVVDFELPAGASIRGRVVDASNQPIAEARVQAWPEKTSSPPFAAKSDREGAFVVANLAQGSYRLHAEAPGFLASEPATVKAGDSDVSITLPRAASVRLRVREADGTIVRRFRVGVRRVLPDRGAQLAFVAQIPDRSVALDPATDALVVEGIPIGIFVCQVECEGLATTFSMPFEVHRTGDNLVELQDVEVLVTPGATLVGQVLDEAGRPLAGASVTTQPDGADPDHPLWRVLAGAAATRATTRTVTTDEEGRFQCKLLALADYQIEVQHPDACELRATGIRLDSAGTRVLAPLRPFRGAVIAGRVTIGGRTAPQVKIVLTSPSNPGGRDNGLRLETIADAEGHFRLPRRVPPGMYELRAAVVDTASPETRHFQQLRQLQRSATPVVVPTGQDRVERDIDIPTDH